MKYPKWKLHATIVSLPDTYISNRLMKDKDSTNPLTGAINSLLLVNDF
jgi:hypothetical protein